MPVVTSARVPTHTSSPSSTVAVAPGCALIGGALWIVQWLLDPGADPLGRTLHWCGLAFVLLAAAVAAGRLVTGDVLPLRLVVAVAAPLLAWSVIEFFRPEGAGWYVGAWGVLAVGAGAWGVWRQRAALVPAPRSRGAHAR